MTWKAKLQTLWRQAAQTLGITTSAEPRAAGTVVTRLTETAATSKETIGEAPSSQHLQEPAWTRRYKFVRKLGHGGMGRVILAERRSDSTLVCLKFAYQTTVRRSAEQECRALMRLRHPSIVSLLDFSIDDDPPWLAMEYATGVTLETYLKQSALPPLTALEIVKQVLEALDHAHGQGVIHRDLKPANLVIDRQEGRLSVRILDFGIAIVDGFDFAGNPTGTGLPIGSFLYMAPEQIEGLLLTASCDLYATGLITWEMLMGRPACQAKNPLELLELMRERTRRTEGYIFTGGPGRVDSALSKFIEACTRPDPVARPAAREALLALETLAASNERRD